ncbi:excisionase family DNA-binding protein [Schinkia sp. CFF1]
MDCLTISAKKAAELLGVSYWQILEMAKRKEVGHIRCGKRVLFRVETLESWMKEQEKQSMILPKLNSSVQKIEI